MDVALDSPLEALALNYLSCGLLTIVNNIWTWVAVVTAAVSFWKISSQKSDLVPALRQPDESSSAPASSSPLPLERTSEPASTSGSTSNSSTTPFRASVDRDGATKGKFTAYYDGDERGYGKGGEEGPDGKLDDVAQADGVGVAVGKEWCEAWERVLGWKMGTGEMGWYRYQDLTVLDGNVVRLWGDGHGSHCRGRNAASDGGVVCMC